VTNHRKRVLKLILILFLFLILCTMISRFIYQGMLPVVRASMVTHGSLRTAMAVIGEFEGIDKEEAVVSTDEKDLRIKWSMTPAQKTQFGDVERGQAVIAAVMQDSSARDISPMDIVIDEKKYNQETGSWEFYARFGETKKIYTATNPNIQLVKFSKMYGTVLPQSCLQTNAQGDNVIYVVRQRQGLFTKEQYIEEVGVEILEEGQIQVAFAPVGDMGTDALAVQYSSKPVIPGMTVHVE